MFSAEHCPPRAPHGLQTKGPDWGPSNNYWMVSLVVIKIIILSHYQKMSLPIFFKKKSGDDICYHQAINCDGELRRDSSSELQCAGNLLHHHYPQDHHDHPFPHPQDDLGLDCPALQDSAEKHSVIWRNAAGDEVQQDGRSPLSNWQIPDRRS